MKPRTQRIWFLSICVLMLITSVSIVFVALKDTMTFFYTPSELAAKEIPPQQRIRIGGMVVENSYHQEDIRIVFQITDFNQNLEVHYQGILPDLFREGQGVVAEGYLIQPGVFHAQLILAKHDENYMPPEIADLKKKDQD